MTSFIISSSNKNQRELYISDFCKSKHIDKFDIALIDKESNAKTTQSIGIAEIKDLHKKIFLKPVNSKTKAVILEDAHLLTIEAQNALLKVLEEPPDNTIIILSVEAKESLLPTILSRCKLIELEPENTKLSDVENIEFIEFIKNLPEMKIGDKLKKAEELAKDKDKAVIWIGKLILALREEMLEENSEAQPAGLETIKSFQTLHTLLKTTNVNPRFAIENTLLNLI